MKKTLIIIMMGIIFNANAQSNNGGTNHFTAGFMLGFTTSTVSYSILANKTKMHPTWCKVIANISALVISNYAGYAWEKYSRGVYNRDDIKHTSHGSFSGVLIGASFTLRSVPKRWVKNNYLRHKSF